MSRYRRVAAFVLPALLLTACLESRPDSDILINVGGTELGLALPAGFCKLDKSNPNDSRLIGMIRKMNRGRGTLYLSVANCVQLKAWRAGQMKTLDDYGFIMVPRRAIRKKIRTSRAAFVKTMERQLNKVTERRRRKIKANMRRRVRALNTTLRLNQTRILGVLKADDTAVHVGVMQKLQTEYGDKKTIVGSFGATLVRKKVLFVYLYTKMQGQESIRAVQSAEEKWLRAIVDING